MTTGFHFYYIIKFYCTVSLTIDKDHILTMVFICGLTVLQWGFGLLQLIFELFYDIQWYKIGPSTTMANFKMCATLKSKNTTYLSSNSRTVIEM